MNRSLLKGVFIVIGMNIAVANLSFAQRADPRHDGTGADYRREGLGMEQRKHLEQLRILKMLELLDLSKEQELPFLTAFNSMREDLRNLEEQANQLIDTLATALESGKSEEPRLRSLIGRIKDVDRRKYERLMSFVDQAETMLTAEQVGKLLIFERRFEAELLEQVGRFRRGMGNPRRPGDPGNPEGEG